MRRGCEDNTSGSYIEVQLRTKEMDDYAEIGAENHLGYEKRQEKERARRRSCPMSISQNIRVILSAELI